MPRQVDALQPDDQDEHQAAPAQAGQQAGQVPGGEVPDSEQGQPEHRLLDPGLDEAENHQHDQPADDGREHERAGPAHGVAVVWLDAVGDPHQHRDQADGERDVAPPVDPGRPALAQLAELQVGPERAEHAERDRDQEDQPPVHRAEQPAQDQPDERARDRGHLVQPQGQAALVGGERVGEQCAGVGHQHGPADALQDPHDDDPHRGGRPVQPCQRQQYREHAEHGEAQVVDPDPADHVAQPAEAHHQHGGDHQVSHDHPQQQAGVPRLQRVHADAPEDVRQSDQHDRGVDRRHQHAERGVRQRDPLVAGPGGAGRPGRTAPLHGAGARAAPRAWLTRRRRPAYTPIPKVAAGAGRPGVSHP